MRPCIDHPETQYHPARRSVQAELWQLLTPEEQVRVACEFRHLKNHVQEAVSRALIAYITQGTAPGFAGDEFIHTAVFIKLTGYSLESPQPTDIRPWVRPRR